MLEKLKESVYNANMALVKHGLVLFTWGNASGIDRESGLIVIKPSGVEYEKLSPENMVVLDLDGNVKEGDYNPSSDTPTHLELYKRFCNIRAVVHTHSTWATICAQAGMSVPVFGTTHSDYFYGGVPCTRDMTNDEINGEYERETGKVISEAFTGIDPLNIPGVLVKSHGPFTWGENCRMAVHNAVVLEEIAKMSLFTKLLNKDISPVNDVLLNRHFMRKHGAGAYYGQNTGK